MSSLAWTPRISSRHQCWVLRQRCWRISTHTDKLTSRTLQSWRAGSQTGEFRLTLRNWFTNVFGIVRVDSTNWTFWTMSAGGGSMYKGVDDFKIHCVCSSCGWWLCLYNCSLKSEQQSTELCVQVVFVFAGKESTACEWSEWGHFQLTHTREAGKSMTHSSCCDLQTWWFVVVRQDDFTYLAWTQEKMKGRQPRTGVGIAVPSNNNERRFKWRQTVLSDLGHALKDSDPMSMKSKIQFVWSWHVIPLVTKTFCSRTRRSSFGSWSVLQTNPEKYPLFHKIWTNVQVATVNVLKLHHAQNTGCWSQNPFTTQVKYRHRSSTKMHRVATLVLLGLVFKFQNLFGLGKKNNKLWHLARLLWFHAFLFNTWHLFPIHMYIMSHFICRECSTSEACCSEWLHCSLQHSRQGCGWQHCGWWCWWSQLCTSRFATFCMKTWEQNCVVLGLFFFQCHFLKANNHSVDCAWSTPTNFKQGVLEKFRQWVL